MRIQWIEMIMHGADKSAEKDPENLPEKFNLKILKAVQVAPHLNAAPTEKDGSGITPMQLGISPSGSQRVDALSHKGVQELVVFNIYLRRRRRRRPVGSRCGGSTARG